MRTQGENSQRWKLGLAIPLVIGGIIAYTENYTLAQVVPDATLGANHSIVIPDALKGKPIERVDGGVNQIPNLFHSFRDFNIAKERGVYFTNPAGIENILIRVTGNKPSHILGTLGVLDSSGNMGTANVFLINPNGIIFGPNASLSIGGSFFASTASSLKFADGTQFSATAHPTTPLLTISVPIGLQFGQTQRSVQVQGSELAVQPGKTLALVGGDVTLVKEATLTAPGGRIELGSVAGPSIVSLTPLTPVEKGWALGYEGVQSFKIIQLSQAAVVDSSGDRGGDIHLQGRQVLLTDASQVLSTTDGAGPGGNLTVNASESVIITGHNSSLVGGTTNEGDGGNVIIDTEKLLLDNRAFVSTAPLGKENSFGGMTRATGRGGNLTVNASESVELIGAGSGLFADTSGVGAAGGLRVTTGKLIVRDGAALAASSGGTGAAGNLEVKAPFIRLDNQGSLSAETTAGDPGNITIHTQDLQLRHNSNITTTASNNANGGNITIDTQTLTALENSDITAKAVTGQGGNIQIRTQGLFLSPDSEINVNSEKGINGTLQINTLGIDPSRGLLTLPLGFVNIPGLIAQGCPASIGPRASKFVVTGRGGLPPTPREALRNEPTLVDLGTPIQGQANHASAAIFSKPTSSEPTAIVEAQGWITNAKGEIVLVAQAPNVTTHHPWQTPPACH